jgi:hypothetical protein
VADGQCCSKMKEEALLLLLHLLLLLDRDPVSVKISLPEHALRSRVALGRIATLVRLPDCGFAFVEKQGNDLVEPCSASCQKFWW